MRRRTSETKYYIHCWGGRDRGPILSKRSINQRKGESVQLSRPKVELSQDDIKFEMGAELSYRYASYMGALSEDADNSSRVIEDELKQSQPYCLMGRLWFQRL